MSPQGDLVAEGRRALLTEVVNQVAAVAAPAEQRVKALAAPATVPTVR